VCDGDDVWCVIMCVDGVCSDGVMWLSDGDNVCDNDNDV
jgi:hypothetical protein